MSKTKITKIHARPLWGGDGFPAIEIEISLRYGAQGRATACLSSSSSPSFDMAAQAVEYIESSLRPALKGLNATDQLGIDETLHQITEKTEHIQAPSLASAISRAVLHAAANTEKLPLWQYLGTYLGNSPADTLPLPTTIVFETPFCLAHGLNIKEFSLIPVGASRFAEALVWCNRVHHHLFRTTDSLTKKVQSDEQAFEILTQAIETVGLRPGQDMGIGLNVCASNLGSDRSYRLAGTTQLMTSDELSGRYVDWLSKFPIVSIEDPFAPDDLEGFTRLTWAVGKRAQIVASNTALPDIDRLQSSISQKVSNAMTLDDFFNRTISDAQALITTAHFAHHGASISLNSMSPHTPSPIHIAVGWGLKQIKTSLPTHPGSNGNWNEGLRIAEAISQQNAGAIPTDGALPPRNSFPWGKIR